MKKILKFVIPLSLVIIFLLSSVLSVGAVGLDSVEFFNYAEYETSYWIDGENDIVYVDLPLSWFYYRIFNDDLTYQKEGYWTFNQAQTFYIPNGGNTYFEFFPFGTPFDLQFPGGTNVSGHFLDLNQLPEGSVFYYVLECGGTWLNMNLSMTYDSASTSIYVNEFGQVVANYDNDSGIASYSYAQWEEFAFTNTINQVGGAKGFAFGHRPFTMHYDYPGGMQDVSFTFNVVKVQLILSIPSLYRMREDSAVTNGLLKDILNSLDQLGDTNNKLDSVINGNVNPVAPDGSDGINDALGSEDLLLDNAINNFTYNSHIFSTVAQIVQRYGSVFGSVTLFLGEFIDISYISSLLYFGLALGVVSVILNIVHMTVRHSGHSDATRDSKPKGKGSK